MASNPYSTALLAAICELIEIPISYYIKAKERYESIAAWLQRDGSTVAQFSPQVYPQGSFRYGTVNRPLLVVEEYDLDLVCQLDVAKRGTTQEHVKALVGAELAGYAKAYSFKHPLEEKHRCWRLNYADGVNFHMDILPCVPEERAVVERLVLLGVPQKLAEWAIAITDNRRRDYATYTLDWPSSNPRGIALWFENRNYDVAKDMILRLAASRAYASTAEVPAFEWKTPLQRSIQLLKRHRDVMFRSSLQYKPISMIITTLAAHSYDGQPDLHEALHSIAQGMAGFIRQSAPRIPNPVNPSEDFADRWGGDARYERNFRAWNEQVLADINSLSQLATDPRELERFIKRKFAIDLPADVLSSLANPILSSSPRLIPASPKVIEAPSKPWTQND